jgi:serine/threonine protein kinase
MPDRIDYRSGDYIANYYVENTLGEGSFGKVFKVRKRDSKNIYALKILKLWAVPPAIRNNVLKRFEMEFLTGKINSLYLVRSFERGYDRDIPYIIMEYCPNGNLLKLIGDNYTTGLVKASTEVLYGLRDLHRCGKVHRDLKPENVLFNGDNTATLTDFGISGDMNNRLTNMGLWGKPEQIFGTYSFMPPEQVNPDREATVLPTTDIFSFGAMLYLILTGQLPFGSLNDDNDLVGYLARSKNGDWNKSALQNDTRRKTFYPVIEGCLAPDYKKRLQTVDKVLELMPESLPGYHLPTGETFAKPVKNGLLLRVMQGEEYGKIYKLNDLMKGKKRIITTGRYDGDTNNSLRVVENYSNYISRKHCTLELDYASQNWYIRDGQWDMDSSDGWKRSTNGTFVNSSEADKTGMPVFPGDIITIGDVKLRAEGY